VRVENGIPEAELLANEDAEVVGNARLENESAMPEPTKIAIIIATATDGGTAR
jgi:hypothetical protein